MKQPVPARSHKYPVPSIERCAPTIAREARYWAPRFRGQYHVDDLVQEGWIVAYFKVARVFDPQRGVKIDTLLTLALRQHFARMVKTVLTKAFLYTEEQRALRDSKQVLLRDQFGQRVDDPRTQQHAREVIDRLRALPAEQQMLAWALVNDGGKIRRVATAQQWTLRATRARVHALRAALTLTEAEGDADHGRNQRTSDEERTPAHAAHAQGARPRGRCDLRTALQDRRGRGAQ